MNLEEATYAKNSSPVATRKIRIEFSITNDQKNYLQDVGYNMKVSNPLTCFKL